MYDRNPGEIDFGSSQQGFDELSGVNWSNNRKNRPRAFSFAFSPVSPHHKEACAEERARVYRYNRQVLTIKQYITFGFSIIVMKWIKLNFISLFLNKYCRMIYQSFNEFFGGQLALPNNRVCCLLEGFLFFVRKCVYGNKLGVYFSFTSSLFNLWLENTDLGG